MNKRIHKILENEINSYTAEINHEFECNDAIFKIFDSLFHSIKSEPKIVKSSGVELITILSSNLMYSDFDIGENSFSNEGIAFLIKFDKELYTIRFKKFRDGQNMVYVVNIKCTSEVNYSGDFMYKYLLFNALEVSKLKGAYFTMPRNRFSWEIKGIEGRTFDDIYLPSDMMEDLHLYVDIFKESGRILRYLKVGNPGTGKTEAGIVLANELNAEGVTIIKTPICKNLHEKVELANVLAPSLIIFDDIDLSLGDRNKGAFSELLGDFLDVLDGTDKLADNVGVIATTNAAHLLDLAAQRPGRFDKTLVFDNLTKKNIKNIILKSLKLNFESVTAKEKTLYTNLAIIDKFYGSGVSGSHIYNAIKMLKLRYDTLKVKDVTVERVLVSIQMELSVIDKIRKTSYLKEKYDRSNSSVGFNIGSDETVEEDYDEAHEINIPLKTDEGRPD